MINQQQQQQTTALPQQKQYNRIGGSNANITLSTSSPLIAKYMNLSTFGNHNNFNNNNSTINNNTTVNDNTSSQNNSYNLSTTTSSSSSNNDTTTTTTNNNNNNSINDTSITSTVSKGSSITSSLNPESYLSTKLNQTRAAREAFLKGNLRPTTISIANNSNITTTNSNSNPKVNGSSPSSISSPKINGNQTQSPQNDSKNSINTSTSSTLNNNNNNNNNSTNLATATLIQSAIQQNKLTTNDNSSNMKYNTQQQHQQNSTYVNLNGNGTIIDTTSVATKSRNLDGYVGFVNLPNQVYRKSVKKGFDFNLMVIGESGLGKSTFINSLFLSELYNNEFPGTSKRKKKTITVDSSTVLLTEKGVNLRLTVVDTPGFGEHIDNSNCWQPIIDYIDIKYEEYLNQESRVNRKQIIDDRIHCCLYFISPGHSLKQLDIEVMKKLHDRVNLIPVIAKADTMTFEEIKEFKKVILNDINANKIQIYEFPDVEDDDIETNKLNNLLKSKLPFAIVGSNTVIEVEGKSVRGRQYPWGVVNVDDLNHCDFMALRTMLIRTHMQDLKDVTNNVHYENYRYKKLLHVAGDKAKLPNNNRNPFQQLDEERRESELRLQKMKAEMEAVFEQKVKEKIARLKESEANLEKQQEAMRISLEKEEKDLELQRVAFIKEMQFWEDSNREEEERLKQTLGKELDKKKKKIF